VPVLEIVQLDFQGVLEYKLKDMPRGFAMITQRRVALPSSRDRLLEAAISLFAEQGYESASTADICRLAGTSQSQLVKHFTNKQGLLEAIFEHAWAQINPAIRMAIQTVSSPREKLNTVMGMILSFLDGEKQLRALFLLEGRRRHGDGNIVVLVPGFLEFVTIIDGILKEAALSGKLQPSLHPQAVRSMLMGALEGMLRDLLIAKSARLPAAYTDADIRAAFANLISCCLSK